MQHGLRRDVPMYLIQHTQLISNLNKCCQDKAHAEGSFCLDSWGCLPCWLGGLIDVERQTGREWKMQIAVFDRGQAKYSNWVKPTVQIQRLAHCVSLWRPPCSLLLLPVRKVRSLSTYSTKLPLTGSNMCFPFFRIERISYFQSNVMWNNGRSRNEELSPMMDTGFPSPRYGFIIPSDDSGLLIPHH